MKYVYVILGKSTDCHGSIIHWADTAYTNKQKAVDVCNRMNRVMQQHDSAYLAYVAGPISLIEMEGLV